MHIAGRALDQLKCDAYSWDAACAIIAAQYVEIEWLEACLAGKPEDVGKTREDMQKRETLACANHRARHPLEFSK